jgi:hypothetical protein
MDRAPLRIALAISACALLGACSGNDLTRTFGLTRDAPDEFQVTTRAPLSMPPDFSLRPPRPGAPRPQETSQRQQAEEALVPQVALGTGVSADTSPGQQALVQAAGPSAPADIRRKLDQEGALDVPDRPFTDKLMFWQSPPPAGTVLDPEKEAQRLRENAALGQSPEQGDTPIIQRTRKSMFDIF